MSTGTVDTRSQEKAPLWWGLIAIAIGVLIVLQALGVLTISEVHAPTWIGALGGLVFVLAGAAIVIQGLGGAPAATGELPASAPVWMRAAQYLLVLSVFIAFAMIASWIALGPGPREFGASLGGVDAPASGVIGRVAFGFGAVICWLCAAGVSVSGLRRLQGRPSA